MEIKDMRVTKVIKTTTEDESYKVTITKGSMTVVIDSPNPIDLNYGDELIMNITKVNNDLNKFNEG